MTIRNKITSLFLEARKSKNARDKQAYEILINSIQNKEIELKGETDRVKGFLTDSEVVTIVQKSIKECAESKAYATKAKKSTEEIENWDKVIELLNNLLPTSLTHSEVIALIKEVTTEQNIALEKKNMGTIVKAVVAASNGRTDGKTVSTLLIQVL